MMDILSDPPTATSTTIDSPVSPPPATSDQDNNENSHPSSTRDQPVCSSTLSQQIEPRTSTDQSTSPPSPPHSSHDIQPHQPIAEPSTNPHHHHHQLINDGEGEIEKNNQNTSDREDGPEPQPTNNVLVIDGSSSGEALKDGITGTDSDPTIIINSTTNNNVHLSINDDEEETETLISSHENHLDDIHQISSPSPSTSTTNRPPPPHFQPSPRRHHRISTTNSTSSSTPSSPSSSSTSSSPSVLFDPITNTPPHPHQHLITTTSITSPSPSSPSSSASNNRPISSSELPLSHQLKHYHHHHQNPHQRNFSITKHHSSGTYHYPSPSSPSSNQRQPDLTSIPSSSKTLLPLQTSLSPTPDILSPGLDQAAPGRDGAKPDQTQSSPTKPNPIENLNDLTRDPQADEPENGLSGADRPGQSTTSSQRSANRLQPSHSASQITSYSSSPFNPNHQPNPVDLSRSPSFNRAVSARNQEQESYISRQSSPRSVSSQTSDLRRHTSLIESRLSPDPKPVSAAIPTSNRVTPRIDPQSHPHHPADERPSSSFRTNPTSPTSNDQRRLSKNQTLSPSNSRVPSSSTRPSMAASATTRARRHLGEYTLGKTLGAGSMGKVKLAVSSITGEKIAIKIIPRHTSLAAIQQQIDKNKENDRSSDSNNQKDSSFIEKAKAKDVSKEIRTIREASIVLLLHHPYICGLKSMLVYPNHYYMLFEYVNGGQMLDYIISHGRLRERAARRFARQMGSALEYCHANSIVHRDLKIENILISKTGNIKIIDFGLSNLFSPNSNLSTFCGSLYFAAPELLNAKVYIGPEVDIWSFGIVLFVLVCGKVPFDDQSMPALHAKIKRGLVEYPTWLSSECKNLLSRMLVTNPTNRATLHEVLNHTWMVKGFEGPPDPHIPPREPLRLNQIDPEVVKGMTGFEFGSFEKIEADLKAVLSSEMYLKVLKYYDERRANGYGGAVEPIYRANPNASGSSVSGLASGSKKDQQRFDRDYSKSATKASKRFSGLGFYGKKVAGGLAAVLNTVGGGRGDDRSINSELGPNAGAGFETVLLNGQTLDSIDPTRGFHPLISVYFLVREKIEREKIYGPGVFASSTISLTGPPPPPAPPSAYKSSLSPDPVEFEKSPLEGHLQGRSATTKTRTRASGSQFDRSPQRDQTTMPLDVHQVDQASQKGRTRLLNARPSTANDRMITAPSVSVPSSPAKPFSPAARHSNPPAQTSEPANVRRSIHIMSSSGSAQAQKPGDVPGPSKVQRAELGLSGGGSGSGARSDRSDRVVSMIEPGQMLSSVQSESERSPSFARRFGSLLGRPSSAVEPDYKRHRPRSSIGGSIHKIGTKTPLSPLPQVSESTTPSTSEPMSPGELQHQQQLALQSSHDQRGDGRAEDGLPMSAPVGGSPWRPRVTSFHESGQRSKDVSGNMSTSVDSEEDERDGTQLVEVDGEESQIIDGQQNDESVRILPGGTRQVEFSGRTGPPKSGGDKTKPIYLKGLFSVATTTTKGPKALRDDLVIVLNRIGVQHREIKGGFECVHVPSIDLSSVKNRGTTHVDKVGNTGTANGKKGFAGGHTGGSIKNKVSNARFCTSGTGGEKGKRGGGMSDSRSQGSGSQIEGEITGPVTPPNGGVVTPPSNSGEQEESNSNPKNKFLSPTGGIGSSFMSNSNNSSSNNQKKYDLVVRFEIFIVKMPLLPGINGLQFRRISGNAWQYHTFARRILQELKL